MMQCCDLGELDRTTSQEIERGLRCARQAHYADAAVHFAVARADLQPGQLAGAIEAFISCHHRYWQSQLALHEASRLFAAVDAEQQVRLNELQQLASPYLQEAQLRSAAPRPNSPAVAQDSAEVQCSPPPYDGALPALSITCFGRFMVRQAGVAVELCQNRRGQAILRYLAAAPRHAATTDALIEALWPDDQPETAHHKLHVAISALRRALNGTYTEQKGGGYILYEHATYSLNPELTLWIDADEFMASYEKGQQAGENGAITHYETACRLYTGTFLSEDVYADWSAARREQVTHAYLVMCNALAAHHLGAGHNDDAIIWARASLEENRCDEAAYRYLMRAYAALGNRAEAIRHYQRCARNLEQELGVQPMPETAALFYALLHDSAPSISPARTPESGTQPAPAVAYHRR